MNKQTDKMKNTPSRLWLAATGGLAAAVLLFALASWQVECGGGKVWQAVRAFAEAAMVGGLADWFAVVALFRHPLGLPIPHTAVLQNSRERLARSVADFFCNSFWVPQQVRGRVLALQPTRALLQAAEASAGAGARLQNCVRTQLLPLLQEPAVRSSLAEVLQGALADLPLEKLAQTAAGQMAQGSLPESAVTLLLQESATHIARNREDLEIQLGGFMAEKASAALGGGMVGVLAEPFVRTALAPMLLQETHGYLQKLAHNPSSPLRVQVQGKICALLNGIASGTVLADEAVNLRRQMLSQESLEQALQTLPQQLVESPAFSPASAAQWLPQLGVFFTRHPQVTAALDALLADLAADIVEQSAPFVQRELEQTILSWDMATMVQRVEEQVGNDLQYIRLNGTLVGGVIGLVIFALYHAASLL